MGLDIECRCGKIGFRAGSYSGFHTFREWIARELGTTLDEIWRNEKEWDEDPWYPFLFHSDCDGYLTSRECGKLLSEFEDLKRKMRKRILDREKKENPWKVILGEEELGGDETYFLQKLDNWIEACRHSSKDKCKLEFR